ncbi:MAG TPA: TetR/AcrR family transcriptional regulator [Solirubrobacterales bacterium]
MAEACAERGYAQTSVAEVAKRAGVSSLTFYKQFAGKGDCMLAAHRQLLGRLLEEVDRASAVESAAEAQPRVALDTALALFAADPPSARLLTVEILAAGPEGARRHDAMVGAFAARLRGAGVRGEEAAVPIGDWVRAAGLLALVGRLVVAGEAERLPQLAGELVATVEIPA